LKLKNKLIKQPLLDEDQEEEAEENLLAGANGFELSDSKIIIWNEG